MDIIDIICYSTELNGRKAMQVVKQKMQAASEARKARAQALKEELADLKTQK